MHGNRGMRSLQAKSTGDVLRPRQQHERQKTLARDKDTVILSEVLSELTALEQLQLQREQRRRQDQH